MKKLIIVEGPQGTGKTTLTNYLRDNLPAINLYRLQGQKDKTLTGKEVSTKMYDYLLNYMEQMQNVEMDLLFDRTFFTEEIYARLGYKEYSFTDVYNTLIERLNNLNYDIYLISLYLEDTNIYEQRLAREHHNYQSFSIQNSVDQQNAYKQLTDELKDYKNIKVIRLAMDNFDKAYQKIDELFEIK